MPFEIVRNDITKMKVDAIVNSASPAPFVGSGVDEAIHTVAGPELFEARKVVGYISVGDAAITSAYNLEAKFVIHTVGPVWHDGNDGELENVKKCYENSLKVALDNNCESIAFPLISTGTFGFPKDKALQAAISAISGFLLSHDMKVFLVVYDSKSFALSEKLFSSVSEFIDDRYIEIRPERYQRGRNFREVKIYENRNLKKADFENEPDDDLRPEADFKSDINFESGDDSDIGVQEGSYIILADKILEKKVCSPSRSIDDLVNNVDESFSQTLLRLIDEKGKTDVEIYKKANVDRKLFSKIRNNVNYRPGKITAIAFAVALELSLDETKDLLGKAGFALSHSSKFDIIVEYFIQENIYNIFEINEVLFAFDQALLGV